MTGYEVNILRNIREDRKRYSRLLQIESKKQQPNTKVVNFLKKLIEVQDEEIKSYEEKERRQMKIKALERTHRLLEDNAKNSRELVEVTKEEYKRKYDTSYLDGVLSSNEIRILERRKCRLREAEEALRVFEQMEFDERK